MTVVGVSRSFEGEESVYLQESGVGGSFVSISEGLRTREMDFFILRYRPTPIIPIMIPTGMHATPIAQNQS